MKTAFDSRSTYQLIDVKARNLTYTAKDSTGQVVDKWEIRHHGSRRSVRHIEGVGITK